MKLRRQTAGCIGQHDVDTARFGRLDGIEANGCGIARSLRNHGHIVAFAPSLELLTRGGTESIACRQPTQICPVLGNIWRVCRIDVVLPRR